MWTNSWKNCKQTADSITYIVVVVYVIVVIDIDNQVNRGRQECKQTK